MLERLLADVLTRVLGQYLHGIDQESINFGVWNGCLELRSLQLLPEALAILFETLGMELPVTVCAGFIGLLRIVVPWKTLGSTPVQVYMEKVTVVARPVRGDASDSSELSQRERRLLRAKLATDDAMREAAWVVRFGEGVPDSQIENVGWASRLASRIIDNMQIEIADVLIRFEDAISNKARPYALAVSCKSIKAVSANASWHQAFIDNGSEHSAFTRKIVQVQGFEITWISLKESQSLTTSGSFSLDEKFSSNKHATLRDLMEDEHNTWRRERFDLASGDNTDGKASTEKCDVSPTSSTSERDAGPTSDKVPGRQLILHPFNGTMRICMSKNLPHACHELEVSSAAVELDVKFPELSLDLDDTQYACIAQTSIYFARLATRGLRPTRSSDWWLWAVEQILPGFRSRRQAETCLTAEGMRQRNCERRRYVSSRVAFLRTRRRGEAEPTDIVRQLETTERNLSFQDVMLYRDFADEEFAVSWKQLEQQAPAAAPARESQTGTATSMLWSLLGYSAETNRDSINRVNDVDIAESQPDRPTGSCVDVSRADNTPSDDVENDRDDSRLDKSQIASSSSARSKVIPPSLCAGISFCKISLRMSKGGYPAISEPRIELILRDLCVGVTATSGHGLVLEAVLGTCEAWDLRRNSPLVYPRVPWKGTDNSGSVDLAGNDTDSTALAFSSVQASDCTASVRLPDAERRHDEESANSAVQSQSGTETLLPGRSKLLQIPNSSYPLSVCSSLLAIRNSFSSEAYADQHSDSEMPGNEKDYCDANTVSRSVRSGSDFERDEDSLSGAPLLDDCASGHSRGACSVESAAASSRISEREFLGLSSHDSGVNFLDHLAAIRIEQHPLSDEARWNVGDCKLSVDVAVGRLEAIIDGPNSALLWGLRFWQPKDIKKDPVMAFLGAAAGARVAQLRMELESALLSRREPIQFDAFICAPRFVFPGATNDSAAFVINLGTLTFCSPGRGTKSHSEWRLSDSKPAAGERYSTYAFTLTDVGVYLAPNFTAAVSADVCRVDESKNGERLPLEQLPASKACVGPSTPVRQFVSDRPLACTPTSQGISIRDVERVVQPFCMQLSTQLLQDAQVVQYAYRNREGSECSLVAKFRIRSQISKICVIFSQRACQHVISLGQKWSELLETNVAPKHPFQESSCEHHSCSHGMSESTERLAHVSAHQRSREQARMDEGLLHSSIAGLDANFGIGTVSLELRDGKGSRILTCAASGIRGSLLKSRSKNISANFWLQSWTVTDGSRGVTAAFRRLAHAGKSANDRGVSPPRTVSSHSSEPDDTNPSPNDAFVHIRYLYDFTTDDRRVSVRFLSLRMVCLRETYVRIASFLYGILKHAKRVKRKAMSSYGTIRAPTRSRFPVENPQDLAGCSSELFEVQSSGSCAKKTGEISPQKSSTHHHGTGLTVLDASFDGFALQLVSAEGALACIEMNACQIQAQRNKDGSRSAFGDIEYFAIRDLTAPLEQHSHALVYRRAPEMLARDTGEEPSSNSLRDRWEFFIPAPGAGHRSFRGAFRGLRVTFLTRFLTIVVQYFSALSRELKPAILEAKSAVEALDMGESTGAVILNVSVDPESSSCHSRTTQAGHEELNKISCDTLIEVTAADVAVVLPRNSGTHEESVSFMLGDIHLDNESLSLDEYYMSWRLVLSEISGAVSYRSPENCHSADEDRCLFVTSAFSEYRVDLVRRRIISGDTVARGAVVSPSTVDESLPAVQVRFIAGERLDIRLSEAQYTVLYFVLTENLAESADSAHFKMSKSMGGAEELFADDNPLPERSGVDKELDKPSPAASDVIAPGGGTLLRLNFQVPELSMIIARGWNVTDTNTHVVAGQFANVSGVFTISDSWNMVAELVSNVVCMTDLRREKGAGMRHFLLSFESETSEDNQSSVENETRTSIENISLSYERAYGQRAKIALVLNCIQLSILPELFRDMSCMAIPGWPFLDSSAFAPDVEYLGRVLVVTLTKSEVLLGANQFPADPRAIIMRGDMIARITWMPTTGARQISLQTKGLSLSVSYEEKQRERSVAAARSAQQVGVRATERDSFLLYPGDGSLEYVGPNVDSSGRRLEISAEYMLCRVNVQEISLLMAICNRLGRLEDSYLSRRSWTQPNPLADAAKMAVSGNKDTLSSNQALATRKTLTLLLSTPAARLLFTDDSTGKFVPVLECLLRDVMLQANMPRVIQFACNTSLNLFNDVKGWWEPGVESWLIETSISLGESGSLAVVLISESKLNINLKPSIISAGRRVVQSICSAHASAEVNSDAEMFWKHHAASERPSVAAFHVKNALGRPVTLWLPRDARKRTVRNQEEIEIDLPRENLVPTASARDVGDDNDTRAKQLSCYISIPGFVPTELSATDVGVHTVRFYGEAVEGQPHPPGQGDDILWKESDLLSAVWDVEMKGGVPLCTLRSLLRVLNESDTTLEVRVTKPSVQVPPPVEDEQTLVHALNPGSCFAVPMELIDSEIRVRPLILDPPERDEESDDDLSPDLDDCILRTDPQGAIERSEGPDIPTFDAAVGGKISGGSSERLAFTSARDGEFESQFAFEWSGPLPPRDWLRWKALDVSERSRMEDKNPQSPALPKQRPSPSTAARRPETSLLEEAVSCSSRKSGISDFFMVVNPRVNSLHAPRGDSEALETQWLDIILQAPLALENALPGILSYQVLRLPNEQHLSRDDSSSRHARVLASGSVQPYEVVHVHPIDILEDCFLSLAFDNSVSRSGITSERAGTDQSPAPTIPPTSFGPSVALSVLRRETAKVCVESSASSSSLSLKKRKDMKELSVRATARGRGSGRVQIWCPFWIRNRSDVNLEFCSRATFYGSASAVKPLPGCPPGQSALPYLCLEGPFISLRRTGASDESEFGTSRSGMVQSAFSEWWTHSSDLGETVKPISIEILSVSLVMEVRPAVGCAQRSMIVTIRNSAWVVNRTPRVFQWCQASALDTHGNARLRSVSTIHPGESQSIHWNSKTDVRAISLRLAEDSGDGFSGWFWSPRIPVSMGAKGEFPAKMYRPKSQEQYIARVVSAKLNGGSVALYVHNEDRNNPPYRILNLCAHRSVAFHQLGSEDRPWLLRPGKSTRYSWDDPLAPARNRQLQVEVIEGARFVEKQNKDKVFGSSDAGWESSIPTVDHCSHREFHHPKFCLSIDAVSADPLIKKGTFSPPLLASISVHGATKIVTFQDAETLSRQTERRSDDTAGSSVVDSLHRHQSPPSDKCAAAVDVPTIVWDEVALPSNESADAAARLQSNEFDARNIASFASDYPPASTLDLTAAVGGEGEISNSPRDVDVKVFITSVGVSIIDSTPLELAYAHACGVFAKFERYSSSDQFSFEITDLQIDNQLFSAAFPILLTPCVSGVRSTMKDEKAGLPQGDGAECERTLALEGKRDFGSKGISIWKSVRGAIRPLEIGLDEEIVVRFISFVADTAKRSDDSEAEKLDGQDGEHQALSLWNRIDEDQLFKLSDRDDSTTASDGLNESLTFPEEHFVMRMYMEELVLYPLKVFLSSSASRGNVHMKSAGYKSASLRLLIAILLNVENCELDFAALQLHHVFDTTQHFGLLVREYYLTQFNDQRLRLLTSNSLIGNPAALFDSVSIGARELFVEPGRAKDSAEFLASVGKGSKSLLANTVGGIVGSFGGMSRALASSLDTAVGDRQYSAERERIHGHQFKGSFKQFSATPAQGVVTGAMSFAHGLSSGVAGLIREPVRGARQGGTGGFFKGVGRGLVGGVVKPVTGAIDLIAEPAVGISRHVTDLRRQSANGMLPVRPPRDFLGNGARLVPFDMRRATGAALYMAIQHSLSDGTVEELSDWVELSEREGRNAKGAADLLWLVIRKNSRLPRGSRRRRSVSASSSSDIANLQGEEISNEQLNAVEKTRIALITESRLLIATLDCVLICVINLTARYSAQMQGEGKFLIFRDMPFDSISGLPSAASCDGKRGISDRSQYRTEAVSNILNRIHCGSVDAREDLQRAMERYFATYRSGYRGPFDGNGSRSSPGIELQNLDLAGAETFVGRQMVPTNRCTASDGRPDVFRVTPLPGRLQDDVTEGKCAKNLDSRSTTQAKLSNIDSLGNADSKGGSRTSDLETSIRRLAMGGTKRAIDSSRSLRFIVANSGPEGFVMHLKRSNLISGVWRVQAPTSIASGTATLFEADSGSADELGDLRRLNSEVRGSVLYGLNSSESSAGASLTSERPSAVVGASHILLEFENSAISSQRFVIRSSADILGRYEGGSGDHATVILHVTARIPRSRNNSDVDSRRSSQPSSARSRVALPLPGSRTARNATASSFSPFDAVNAAGGRLFKAGGRLLGAATSFGSSGRDSTSRERSTAGQATETRRQQRGDNESSIDQLTQLGFDRDLVIIALNESDGDVVRAVDMLTK